MKPGSRSVIRIRTFMQDAAEAKTATHNGPVSAAHIVPQETIKAETLEETETLPRANIVVPIVVTPLPTPPPSNRGVPPAERKPQKPIPPISGLSVLNDKVTLPEQDTRSTIFTEENNFSEGSLDSGTIIRETRRNRFRLFPAIIEAAMQWFQGQQTDYAARRPKVPTIEKSEVRAAVIQKAARSGGQAPREDFAVVAKRLKSIERKPLSGGLAFKPKEKMPAPSWSHVVETKEKMPPWEHDQDREAPQETVAAIDDDPIEAEPAAPAVALDTREEPEASPRAAETNPAIEAEAPSMPDLDAAPIEQAAALEVPRRRAYRSRERTSDHQRTAAGSPAIPTQEHFPLSLLIGVIIATTVSGVAVAYAVFAHHSSTAVPQTTETRDISPVPSLLRAQSKTAVQLAPGRISFLQSIQIALQQSQDVVQVYPIVLSGDIKTPAPLGQTLESLAWLIPDSFLRSIKEIDFGGIDGTDPYIVIRSSTFDTAFAGMLQWEAYMSGDLDPLFGPTVTHTFDPTAVQTPGAHFKDAVASNKNVRILFDAQGKDHIVYTFTDQNTILITTTRTALDKLLQRMQ